MTGHHRYIPALRFEVLTPLYDTFHRWFMPEQPLKRELVAQAQIQDGQSVLDLGAGTGTLTVMIKETHPEAHLYALDGDPHVLAIAQEKALAAGTRISFRVGRAENLPYPDESFDRVVTSLMLHHLNSQAKRLALEEVWRVLRPSGEVHILDLGEPHSLPARVVSLGTRSMEEAADNIRGLVPGLLRQVGFHGVSEEGRRMTLFGTVSRYAGRKPGPHAARSVGRQGQER